MNRSRLLLALAAAVLLGAASPASARGPSTSDQGSLDWILLRFAKDREEEMKGGGVVDEVVAFRQGDTPLEEWRRMFAIVLGPEKPARKEQAAQAIVDRFALEDGKKAIEPKAYLELKKLVCRGDKGDNLNAMLGSNSVILQCVFKIQRALLPSEWVAWSPSDSLTKRKDARKKLAERLK